MVLCCINTHGRYLKISMSLSPQSDYELKAQTNIIKNKLQMGCIPEASLQVTWVEMK